MKREKDYNLYVAKLNIKKIASLLLLYFNKTVEYFTPTVLEDYLNLQPMALILNKAIDEPETEFYESLEKYYDLYKPPEMRDREIIKTRK